jgi:hypothetical protein
MGARTARIGFVGYAATLVALAAIGFWHSFLIGRLGHDFGSGLDWQLKIVGALYLALEVLAVVALVFMGRVPAVTRARGLLLAAAIVGGVAFAVGLVQRLMLEAHVVSYERLETMLRIVGVTTAVTWAASEILLAVAALRIAGAVGDERVRALALGAIVVRALVLVVGLVPARIQWLVWAHRGNDLLFAALCVSLALVVMRVAEPETAAAADGASDGRLERQWRAPADGIALYLGAGVARVLCALLGWVVMYGARSAQGVSDLRDVRAQLLMVATLSALATIGTLAGLWRIASAPPSARASGPALVALTLALIAFGLDLWGTYITADALEGHVSAAFFAMDALPIIGGVAGLLGLGVAVSLLIALANLATALACGDAAARARGAIGWVLGTGALVGTAFAAMRTVELMLPVAVIALPVAITALVQFLRAALAIRREIAARL